MKPDAHNGSYCACLGLVDLQNWQSDRAIPLIVSRSVIKSSKSIRHRAAWVEEVQGVLHINEDVTLTSFIPRATYHDSQPPVTAWTMFETKQDKNPYRYTYFVFNPTNEESFAEATEFLQNYVRDYDGNKIVTDYDGVVPRLEAAYQYLVIPFKRIRNKRES